MTATPEPKIIHDRLAVCVQKAGEIVSHILCEIS